MIKHEACAQCGCGTKGLVAELERELAEAQGNIRSREENEKLTLDLVDRVLSERDAANTRIAQLERELAEAQELYKGESARYSKSEDERLTLLEQNRELQNMATFANIDRDAAVARYKSMEGE